MLDRLTSLIFQLLAAAVVIFLATIAGFLVDGSRDSGDHADVALVPGHADLELGAPWSAVQERLDAAIQLYNKNKFSAIIVSGVDRDGNDEVGKMVQYLEGQGIPSAAIIGDEEGIDTRKMAVQVAQIMKERNMNTVMIVTHYYQVTRLKLALKQAGVPEVWQTHVGTLTLDKAAGYNVLRDVVAFYNYLWKYYMGPVQQKTVHEAKKAKHAVDNWLRSASK